MKASLFCMPEDLKKLNAFLAELEGKIRYILQSSAFAPEFRTADGFTAPLLMTIITIFYEEKS